MHERCSEQMYPEVLLETRYLPEVLQDGQF